MILSDLKALKQTNRTSSLWMGFVFWITADKITKQCLPFIYCWSSVVVVHDKFWALMKQIRYGRLVQMCCSICGHLTSYVSITDDSFYLQPNLNSGFPESVLLRSDCVYQYVSGFNLFTPGVWSHENSFDHVQTPAFKVLQNLFALHEVLLLFQPRNNPMAASVTGFITSFVTFVSVVVLVISAHQLSVALSWFHKISA